MRDLLLDESTFACRDTDVWQAFVTAPAVIPCLRREFPEWHQGRDRFCFWGLLLDQQALAARVHGLRRQLAEFLVLPYPRQPHLTLAACGFLSGPDDSQSPALPQVDDNYLPALREWHITQLRALAAKPFTLRIGSLNSFTSAMYLEVDDPSGTLARIRACLPGYFEVVREVPYVPHITLGVYRQAWSTAQVAAAMRALDGMDMAVVVEGIQLLSYCARDIGSTLRVEAEVILG